MKSDSSDEELTLAQFNAKVMERREKKSANAVAKNNKKLDKIGKKPDLPKATKLLPLGQRSLLVFVPVSPPLALLAGCLYPSKNYLY